MNKVTANVKYGCRAKWDTLDEWQRNANQWTVTLKYDGRQMTVDFFTGTGIPGEPTAETVIECLLSDAYALDNDSFESWASDLGYDTDSRKAERIYNQVIKQSQRLQQLLGEDFTTFLYCDIEAGELAERCK